MSLKAGVLSGIAATFVCNPLDIIRINIQAKNTSSIYTIKEIYKKYGVSGFYTGTSMGLITIPAFWAIYFPLYETLNTQLNTSFSAYISCNVASTITCPLWYVRQKRQTFSDFNISRELKKGNYRQFYTGLLSTYLINSNFIFQIPIYEYFKNYLNAGSFNIFLSSSLSKVCASLITFPLDNIRVVSRQNPHISIVSILTIIKNNNNFYKGLTNYLIRSIPYHGTIFCTYEYLRH